MSTSVRQNPQSCQQLGMPCLSVALNLTITSFHAHHNIHDYPITANTSDSLYMIRAHSFPWKICKILHASSRNSAAHRGKIVQILQLVTASHL